MNVEKSHPPGPDPAHRKNRTEPNSEEFEKYKRVEKVHEVDPEEQRKRKRFKEPQDTNSTTSSSRKETTSNLKSPFDAYQKKQGSSQPSSDFVDSSTNKKYNLGKQSPQKKQGSLPKSPGFWKKNTEEKTPSSEAQRGEEQKAPAEANGMQSSEEGLSLEKFEKEEEKKAVAKELSETSIHKKKVKKQAEDLIFLKDDKTEKEKQLSLEGSEDQMSVTKHKSKNSGTFIVSDEDLIHPKKPTQAEQPKVSEEKAEDITVASSGKMGVDTNKHLGRKKDSASSDAKHLDDSSESAFVSIGKSEGHDPNNRERKKDVTEVSSSITRLEHQFPQIFAQAAQISSPLTNYMHPDVAQLFSQMVGTMMVMIREEVTTTEITLTSPNFVASPFYGAKISLDKFSTAPDAFNIRITGSEKAVNLCNANADELMAAFQGGNFRFKVQRFETSLDTHGGTFKRKPKLGGDAGGSGQR